MKCIIILGFIACAFAATTPAVVEDELTTQIEKLSSKLFTATCTNDEWSNWLDKCVWYKGNLIQRFKAIVDDMKETGCKVPTAAMLKQLLKRFGNYTWWTESPIVKKLPDAPCGFCGRKIKCCNKGTNFLIQSYASETCETSNTPCTLEPLTATDFEYMSTKYTDWTHTFSTTTNTCSYNLFFSWALNRFENTKFFKVVKPLMCQLFGTTQPTVNCGVNTEGKCFCCCTGYTPVNGVCVTDPNWTTTTTTTTATPTTTTSTATTTTTTFNDGTCDNI